jgi:PAS domain S-box-containing protein
METTSSARARVFAMSGVGAVLAAAVALSTMAAAPAWMRPGISWVLVVGGFAMLAIMAAGIKYFDMMDRLADANAAERRVLRKLQDVIEISNDVYVELDASMRIVDVSSRIGPMTGMCCDSLRGISVEQLRGDPAESEDRAVFWQAVAERQPFRDVFAPIALPNGARCWVKGSGQPIHDEDGEFTGYRCMVFGLSETEVRGSSQVHQDRMRALGQLAGGIAHDFNNLLASILGFSSLLQEDLQGDKPRLALVQRVLTATTRAKDLVQRILSFARVDPGSAEDVPIGETIDALAPLLRASLPSSTRIEIVKDVAGETLRIDPAQLENLLVNLCANANDALKGNDGTVTVSVARADAKDTAFQLLRASDVTSPDRYSVLRRFNDADRILIGHVEPARAYVQLSVADNGIGIDPKILSRIFDPYFTTKAAGMLVGKGGLGLSVVHGVVLGAGGALAVSTHQDRGTTIDMFLPLSDDRGIGLLVAAVGTGAFSGRVLVVDDEPDVRELATIALSRRGLTVISADNGAEALTMFEADPSSWDAVVTDHGMPGMRGEELVRRIKEISPETPCLLCTGFSDTVTEDSARRSGADAFLPKPATPDVLQSTVVHLIAIRRAERRT